MVLGITPSTKFVYSLAAAFAAVSFIIQKGTCFFIYNTFRDVICKI